MKKIGAVFQFEVPDGWRQFQDGSRLVFHGPDNEELMISTSVIDRTTPQHDAAALQRKVFSIAERCMTDGAAHPDLTIIQPLQANLIAKTRECCTLLAQARDGKTLFYQAAFGEPRGVLIASLEAPNTTRFAQIFDQFARSVEGVPD